MSSTHAPASTPPAGRHATPAAGRGEHVPAAATWWAPAVLPQRWTAVGASVLALLLLAHLVVNLLRTTVGDFPGRDPAIRFLALNEETGLPAWFSAVLLLFVAQGLWLLADADARSSRSRWSRHERILAAVFVYLSVDEATALHEQTIAPLRSALDLGGALFFAWVVLYVPLALLVAVLSLRWLRGLPREAGRLVVLAGALYVAGAVGTEMVGAWMWTQGLVDTMRYAVVVTVEEGLEMAGALLMLGVVTWVRRTPGVRSPEGTAPA